MQAIGRGAPLGAPSPSVQKARDEGLRFPEGGDLPRARPRGEEPAHPFRWMDEDDLSDPGPDRRLEVEVRVPEDERFLGMNPELAQRAEERRGVWLERAFISRADQIEPEAVAEEDRVRARPGVVRDEHRLHVPLAEEAEQLVRPGPEGALLDPRPLVGLEDRDRLRPLGAGQLGDRVQDWPAILGEPELRADGGDLHRVVPDRPVQVDQRRPQAHRP